MNVKLAPPDAGAILMDEKVLAEQIARIGQRHPRTAQEVIFLNGREIFSMARDPSWRKKFGEASLVAQRCFLMAP